MANRMPCRNNLHDILCIHKNQYIAQEAWQLRERSFIGNCYIRATVSTP